MLINSVTRTLFFNLFIDATFDRLKKALQPVQPVQVDLIPLDPYSVYEIFQKLKEESKPTYIGRFIYVGTSILSEAGKDYPCFRFLGMDEVRQLEIEILDPELYSDLGFKASDNWEINPELETTDPEYYSDLEELLES